MITPSAGLIDINGEVVGMIVDVLSEQGKKLSTHQHIFVLNPYLDRKRPEWEAKYCAKKVTGCYCQFGKKAVEYGSPNSIYSRPR